MKTLGIIVVGLTLAQTSLAEITVSSSAFQPGGTIPAQFTCKGANSSPPLQFQGIPKEAKSLVLIVDDSDAPGGLFTHWIVWNIDPGSARVDENSVPTGAIEGTNDFGKTGYGGPCPPSGTHRYYFHLYAVDRKLALKAGARRAALERELKNHILTRGELMARSSH